MPGPVPQGGSPNQGQSSPGVGAPFLGLFFDRPAHEIPASGFSACNNVRIWLNTITNWQCGWVQYFSAVSLQPVSAICGGGIFQLSTEGFQYLVVANKTDLYAYCGIIPAVPSGYFDASIGPVFITPTYTTGTVDCDGAGNLTGHGTSWNTNIGTAGFRKNMRIGDYIYLNNPGSTTANLPGDTHWHRITARINDTSATIADAGPIVSGVTYTLRQTMNNDTFDSRVCMEVFPNAGAPDNQDLAFFCNFGGADRFSTVAGLGNGQDPIVWWDPTKATANYLSAAAFTCGVMRRFNNVMVYGRLSNAGVTHTTDLLQTSIASSDNGLPKTLSGGVTFQGVVSDGPDPIQRLGILGNSLLIYTGSNSGTGLNTVSAAPAGGSIISASFVGLPTVWQFQTVVRNRSPLTGALVAEFTDRHEFITVEGQFRYNGMFLQVMNDHVWRGVIPNIDVDNMRRAFCAPMPEMGDVIWYIPQVLPSITPGAVVGYVEHYLEMANSYLFKPYTQRDGFNVTDSYTLSCFLGSNTISNLSTGASRGGALIGSADGSVKLIPGGTSGAPSQVNNLGTARAMASSVTFASRVVAGERARGLVKRIYPFLETQPPGVGITVPVQSATPFTLSVALAMQDRIGGATTLTDTQTILPLSLDTGTANRFTTHYRRGRVAKITFSTTGQTLADGLPVGDCTFILDGYDWDLPMGSKGGQR